MAKIDVMLPDLRAGGFEKVRVLLANCFVADGHRVKLVLMQRQGELFDQLDNRVEVSVLDAKRGRSAIASMARHLKANSPDAILAGLWPLTTITALAVKISRTGSRLVLSEHNQLSQQYAGWGKSHNLAMRASLAIGHRIADSSVAVSRGVAHDVENLAWLSRGTVKPIYNPIVPVDGVSDTMMEEAEEIWSTPRGARILNVGTLKAQKNQELLLKAFAALEMPNKVLVLVGDGPERHNLQRLAQNLDVEREVRFAGFQSSTTAFYRSADLFVLSSDYEGMPNVVGEALAAGTNVVSTDCPSGPREILDEGNYGALVPLRDIASMTSAISRMLTQPISSSVLRARTKAFSPDAIASAYLSELLG